MPKKPKVAILPAVNAGGQNLHRCHVLNCRVHRRRWQCICEDHWQMIPESDRDRILNKYRKNRNILTHELIDEVKVLIRELELRLATEKAERQRHD